MDPKDFAKALEKAVSEIAKEATSKASLQDLGDEAAVLIKKRTRIGYGLSEHNGTKEKLKPLSAPYKKFRKTTTLSTATNSNKSNLTLTGQMLDNIGATVDGESVTIGFKDKFASDKAGWVSVLRPFNFLSKAEIAQLRKRLEDRLISKFKDILGN